ncbi:MULTISPECIES: hypothetical protein [Prauserella salsuginis group]|uniref:Uncharacterized protein n=2 Tax=Prauserella salsuginis group TaxID=2893672 RepID=A0A839XQZ4_9PSEU|nr:MULTISPECIES: hypothetical protein [Prauserella salsuginis group]MBB3664389.1 hypothetical protein [Prauserella sediminis]MCR3721840.1 hypothetical protein [Prauserella flava]MCR3734531.1 hypothetical protein [Prauserella salsuginis]
MLYIVLILVLGALGLVVAALITADSLWAWISLGVSVVAAILLVIDWWRRRSAGSDAKPEAEPERAESDDEAGKADSERSTASDTDDEDIDRALEEADDAEEPVGEGQTELIAAEGDLADPDDEPATENSADADALLVSRLEEEVVVVDERPRYHLAECAWLETRETIPLPAREARELGFSPCGRCAPDATLAQRHRNSAGA